MQKKDKVKGAKANVVEFNPGFTPNKNYVEILDIVKAVSDVVDIQDAKILVSGGRGVGSPENFKILEELAAALGGQVSCSRAVVDSGWKPKELQVGQTGKTVRPHVYFAIGISGAIQHVAGMEESDIIIAINKDETAPIFDVADYGVVGDLNKIVPDLTKKILEAKAAKAEHPDALFLVHPECVPQVTHLADYVGSTSGIMDFARKSDAKEFIIGTETSIAEHLQYECPDKKFYPVTKDIVCRNMKITTLPDVYNTLTGMDNGEAFEILMSDELITSARKCIDEMIRLGG
jgi:hypothetical protein